MTANSVDGVQHAKGRQPFEEKLHPDGGEQDAE